MIKNIVLDMGGVVFDIDAVRANARFKEIGFTKADDYLGPYGQKGIFLQLEKGDITADEFLSEFAKLMEVDKVPLEDNLSAWLSYINKIPQERLDFIESLRKDYKMYLLSNTNPFIWGYVDSPAFCDAGRPITDYFDEVFCSYKIRCYKPDVAMFERLLNDTGIDPAESIFIDDGPKNIAVADSLGMKTLLAPAEGGWEAMLRERLAAER